MKLKIFRKKNLLSIACLIFQTFLIIGCQNPPFIQTYTIKYTLGEYTNGTPPVDDNLYISGQQAKLAAAPTRENYRFASWNDGKDDYPSEGTYTIKNRNALFSAKWTAFDQVAIPTFNITDEVIKEGTCITISSATKDAIIYYTLDGTSPTIQNNKYSEIIIINSDTTIKAMAIKDGMQNSEIATKTYKIIPHSHTYDLKYDESKHWEESICEHQGLIRAEEKHTLIEKSIIVPPTTTTQGIVLFKCAKCDYEITNNCYKTNKPILTIGYKVPQSGTKVNTNPLCEEGFSCNIYAIENIGSGTIVTITPQNSTDFYYTLDGTIPDETSNKCTDFIEIPTICELNVIAIKEGFSKSDTNTMNITKPYNRSPSTIYRHDACPNFPFVNDGYSGYFILYETLPDLSGPDFTKQHYIWKIDDGNACYGDGINDYSLSFDNLARKWIDDNFTPSPREFENYRRNNNNYVTVSTNSWRGTLWIKDIYEPEDYDNFLGTPQVIDPYGNNLYGN